MVKYVDTAVVFEEIPDCVTLAVTISNCPFHCKGCHSEYLREDVGEVLDNSVINTLLEEEKGVNCFLFLGDSRNPSEVAELAGYIKRMHPRIKTAVYSGYDTIIDDYKENFDYVKTGKYVEEFGPLSSKTTNQRLYKKKDGKMEDITYMFHNRF